VKALVTNVKDRLVKAVDNRQVPQVAAGRFDPVRDPAQAAGPVPGPGHQVRDLGDVLVVLGGAVLAGAGLPRVGRDLADSVLVGYLQPQPTCL
jgi:hypothetical protein